MMINHIMLQRWGMYAASLIMLSQAPIGAQVSGSKHCKKFGSLVVKCALNAGCLSVRNNIAIGGNLTVSGSVTTNTGSIGDLLAYGTWINTVVGGPIASGANVTFPTVVGTPDNITVDATNSIFTVNLAGTYLISYQVLGSSDAPTFLVLQHTPAGGTIGNVTGGTMDFPSSGTALEISNVILVPSVGVGDTFNLNNGGANIITLFDTLGAPANGATITFVRIHA